MTSLQLESNNYKNKRVSSSDPKSNLYTLQTTLKMLCLYLATRFDYLLLYNQFKAVNPTIR